ncbi:hypothetical protein NDA15_007364 [Ustilago hordei]|nr:hypothetical protein NDA15_007364 [Ustilago hordei]
MLLAPKVRRNHMLDLGLRKYTCTLVLVDNYSNFIPRDTDRQEAESYPIRSRNQMESNEALEWLLEKGIEWQTTIGYNSRQNG